VKDHAGLTEEELKLFENTTLGAAVAAEVVALAGAEKSLAPALLTAWTS
jgi:hypothetical protein